MVAMLRWTLILIAATQMLSCAQDETNVELSASTSEVKVLPIALASCYAMQTPADDGTITTDISADSFEIPTLTISRKETSKNLIISYIRVKVPAFGSLKESVDCMFAAEKLRALGSFSSSSLYQAIIPSGTASFTTDCPLRCGGVASTDLIYMASGTVELVGAEVDPNNSSNSTGVKISVPITITNNLN
ncbi:MAG: hypothetical protein AAGB31_10685 [Bdellovibrio sp.]